MKTITFGTAKTPFGLMGFGITKKGLCRIYFPEDAPFEDSFKRDFPRSNIIHDEKAIPHIRQQFQEYFSGNRKSFDIKLDLHAPPFYTKALKEVMKVPFGQIATYQDIAVRSGHPKAVRAAGSANANNPLPIVIPCHRIVKTGGNLGGYGGKLERKVYLLELENSL